MRSNNEITLIMDMDGVICENNHGSYKDAPPNYYAIEQINKAYDLGYNIVIATARYGQRHPGHQYQYGYEEAIEWLRKYNVKFHELQMGKAAGDIYVDDKGCQVRGNSGVDWAAFWERVGELNNKNQYNEAVDINEEQDILPFLSTFTTVTTQGENEVKCDANSNPSIELTSEIVKLSGFDGCEELNNIQEYIYDLGFVIDCIKANSTFNEEDYSIRFRRCKDNDMLRPDWLSKAMAGATQDFSELPEWMHPDKKTQEKAIEDYENGDSLSTSEYIEKLQNRKVISQEELKEIGNNLSKLGIMMGKAKWEDNIDTHLAYEYLDKLWEILGGYV